MVVEHRVTADGVDNVAAPARDVRRLRRADRVDRRHRLRAARPDARGHAPRDRTRGAGSGRGDAVGQPARSAVARHRRRPRAGDHLQHAGLAEGLRRAARRDPRRRCRTRCACSTIRPRSTDAPASTLRIACCVLRLVLPKGSLEKATLELFEAADLPVVRSSSVDYKATIDDPRIAEVRILRPQEIPTYVAEGLFDIGITGRDWVEETGSDVVSLGELRYSKATATPDPGGRRRSPATRRRSASKTCRRVCVSAPSTPSSPAATSHRRASTPTSGCRTGPARRRSPTSPTASSTSPRPVGPCAPLVCGSSTRSCRATPRWSPTRHRTTTRSSGTRWVS